MTFDMLYKSSNKKTKEIIGWLLKHDVLDKKRLVLWYEAGMDLGDEAPLKSFQKTVHDIAKDCGYFS